jgi:hypothetical protein
MGDDAANKHVPMSLRVAAATIAAVAVIGGAGFFFGEMKGAGDLRAWERAGGERFKELLDNMGKVSADLKDRLRVYDENQRLRSRVAELDSQASSLRREADQRRVEAAQAVQRANELREEVDSLRGKRRRFTLVTGTSTELAPGAFLGLQNLDRVNQRAQVNLLNELKDVSAGTTLPVPNRAQSCTLAVIQIPSVWERQNEVVTFDFGCLPPGGQVPSSTE